MVERPRHPRIVVDIVRYDRGALVGCGLVRDPLPEGQVTVEVLPGKLCQAGPGVIDAETPNRQTEGVIRLPVAWLVYEGFRVYED